VIGGGGPAQVDLGTAHRIRSQSGRSRRRLSVGSSGDGSIHVRLNLCRGKRDVVHPHFVNCSRTQERRVGGGCGSHRCSNLDKVGPAGVLAAFDQITSDGNVIGGGGPTQVDLGTAHRIRGQSGWSRRRLSVGSSGDGSIHVRLNLCRCKRHVVHPHFVNCS